MGLAATNVSAGHTALPFAIERRASLPIADPTVTEAIQRAEVAFRSLIDVLRTGKGEAQMIRLSQPNQPNGGETLLAHRSRGSWQDSMDNG
jgi:hypothetical protein